MKLSRENEKIVWKTFYVSKEDMSKSTPEDGEEIMIGLRYLKYKDLNRIQDEAYEIQTTNNREIKTAFNYSKYCEAKLTAAIAAWKNITDENGKEAEVNIENVRMLPCWLAQELEDEVDAMNSLGTNLRRD